MSAPSNDKNVNMGSKRVQEQSGAVSLYDAIGQDSLSAPCFVRHIGLSLESVNFEVKQQLSIRMVDMIPPLSDPEKSEPNAIDVVASVELSAAEVRQIKVFVDELVSEYRLAGAGPRAQYAIYPHFVERNGNDSCRRYSCVGFVVNAYSDAGIDLIELDQLPDVDVETLVIAYPDYEPHLRNSALRSRFGLKGDGPWPVLLPGYVFHAMNRTPAECRESPYSAKNGDKCFPANSTE